MEKTVKILFIDDEEIVLASCRRILKREPYEIATALSGEEGLKKAREDYFDIVITDLMMPGMNGMEVLENLKKERPGTTVIIFTGYATVDSARNALKAGAFDYIPKPFTNEELREVIKNAIKARESDPNSGMLDLMAIVSHDLRSPISSVHTTAEVLFKGYFGNLEPEQKKRVEAILNNCQYLEDIIRCYIDLSKMGIDDIESFKEKTNLVNAIVKPALTLPEYDIEMKKMRISADYRANPEINCDPNLIKIVVTNLINNAIKYGKDGTEIKVGVYEDGGDSVFSVYNEGVGISKNDIENKLFKKFGRLKQKGTEGIKGSGLGLYICKTIIEKHQGKIWAESEEGKWVRFSFSLPKG
jgi:signal transduction histidine kinase